MPNQSREQVATEPPSSRGVLWLVSTPIGNMGDLTARARACLGQADLILCEDTRHSRPLLNAAGARGPVRSLHQHNEERSTAFVIERLRAGARVALISDAGTPLLSDPGFRLVRACIEADLDVVPVPGASALLAATTASGLVDGPFTFWGFLPRRGRERRQTIANLSSTPHPSVLYEAAKRVATTLRELCQACGAERPAAVCRELTKRFEEIRRGPLAELASAFAESPPRGEIVIVISGFQGAAAQAGELRSDAVAAAAQMRRDGRTVRDIARTLHQDYAIPRNAAYALARESDHRELDEK